MIILDKEQAIGKELSKLETRSTRRAQTSAEMSAYFKLVIKTVGLIAQTSKNNTASTAITVKTSMGVRKLEENGKGS